MPQPGFMVYADDWREAVEDYDREELGALFAAMLRYFINGETTEFDDRAMRQCFRNAAAKIDLDRDRYAEKCITNAYNRYIRECKDKKWKPLSREQWLTTVYDRQPP